MPLYDFVKKIFGFPANEHEKFDDRFHHDESKSEYSQSNLPYDDNISSQLPDSHLGPGFNMFSDPIQMHRYFEHQINELMKSFNGMFGSDDNVFGFQQFEDIPAIGPSFDSEVPKQNLRDHFLKPGYERSSDKKNSLTRSDSDVDGRVDLGDLDSILKEKPRQTRPYQGHFKMFSESITTKSIQRPDGTIETHRTVRDHEGNEETTITRKIGDKQHSITLRTDKEGQKEKIENFTNIDEQGLSKFNENWNHHPNNHSPDLNFNKWFPFDKFFK